MTIKTFVLLLISLLYKSSSFLDKTVPAAFKKRITLSYVFNSLFTFFEFSLSTSFNPGVSMITKSLYVYDADLTVSPGNGPIIMFELLVKRSEERRVG